jgi:hypothetical protein
MNRNDSSHSADELSPTSAQEQALLQEKEYWKRRYHASEEVKRMCEEEIRKITAEFQEKKGLHDRTYEKKRPSGVRRRKRSLQASKILNRRYRKSNVSRRRSKKQLRSFPKSSDGPSQRKLNFSKQSKTRRSNSDSSFLDTRHLEGPHESEFSRDCTSYMG